MKKRILVFASLIFFGSTLYGQHISDQSSKSYYDEEKTKLKEVYNFIEVNTFSERGDNQIIGTKMVKHGPYFYYYENGKLRIQGNYKRDQRHGTWTYYDESGKTLRVEEYRDGELISTK